MTDKERKDLKNYYFRRRLAAAHVFGDALIGRIAKAFADVPRPEEEFVAGSRAHNEHCEECRAINDALAGRRWQDCRDESSRRALGGGQNFLSLYAWHYFLPAHLTDLVETGRFYNYDFAPAADAEIFVWQRRRFDLLTADQCAAVVRFLEIARKVWEGLEKGYQDDPAPLRFWRAQRRRAQRRERDTKR